MDIKQFEQILNEKLMLLLDRKNIFEVNVRVYLIINPLNLRNFLWFEYKGQKIYEEELSEYGFGPVNLKNIEYRLIHYPDCPLTKLLITKIKEYDKNSWYKFLAP